MRGLCIFPTYMPPQKHVYQTNNPNNRILFLSYCPSIYHNHPPQQALPKIMSAPVVQTTNQPSYKIKEKGNEREGKEAITHPPALPSSPLSGEHSTEPLSWDQIRSDQGTFLGSKSTPNLPIIQLIPSTVTTHAHSTPTTKTRRPIILIKEPRPHSRVS